MPPLRLTGKSGTRTAPKRKPAAKTAAPPARKRKPAAKQAPKRKPAAKQAPQAQAASTNGGSRGPKLPEGWTKSDFNKVVKEMQKTRATREAAQEKLSESKRAANALALEMISEGIQMSVVSTELDLSRQWLYNLMENLYEEYGYSEPVKTERQQAAAKPAARKRAAKPAATKKPAAKKRPAAKAAAKSAPARKRPAAKKAPARKRPAGGGTVRRISA